MLHDAVLWTVRDEYRHRPVYHVSVFRAEVARVVRRFHSAERFSKSILFPISKILETRIAFVGIVARLVKNDKVWRRGDNSYK